MGGDLFFNRGRFRDSLNQRCKFDLAHPPSMAELAALATFVGAFVAAFVSGVIF